MLFEKEYKVRYSEVGENLRVTLPSLVAYLQDTAMFHSDSVGMGVGDISSGGRAWLLSNWHIKIEKYPVYAQKILVRTWAQKFVGVYGYRGFEILDEKGEKLAQADSVWIYFNTERMKLCRVDQSIADAYGIEGRQWFEEERRMRAPQSSSDIRKYTVEKRDIDTNSHVNNVRYIDYVLSEIEDEVHELRITYKKEAHLGDEITVAFGEGIYVLKDDNGDALVMMKID